MSTRVRREGKWTKSKSAFVLLHRYLSYFRWWIAATLLGWLLPFVIGPVFTAILPPDRDIGFVWVRLGLPLMGAMIGLPQWWVLRLQVRHAAWWILAYGFGWGMIGLINRQTSEPLAVLFALAVMPAIATGLARWLLLDWFPKHGSEVRVSDH